MAQIASLLVPGVNVPQRDTSWLDGIFKSLGGAVDQFAENKAFNGLADRLGSSGGTQAASLTTQPAGQSVAGTAPITPVDRGPMQGDTYQPFIDTVKGRVTNPYGLSAVAATGRAESGWSGANAGRTWNDPSQSGQAGTSGGILSWRGPRLASLQAYARSKGENGNGSPSTQAEFFLQENPQLIDQLNNAKSSDEAAGIMANAWRFAGHDRQGGEAARRRALAQNYYANEFSGMPMEQGDTAAAYVDPTVSTPAGRAARSAMPSSGAGVSLPGEIASSAGNVIAQGMTPVQRGGVDPETIQYMLRNPQLRETGLKLWAANAQGQKAGEPWQFVTLPDGTLARANQQTGAVESLGQFAKPAAPEEPKIVELFDEATGQPYKARYDAATGQYERVGGVKARSGMQLTTNPDGTVSLTEGPINSMPKLSESEGRNTGFYGRGEESHKILSQLEDQGTSIWNKTAGNLPVVGNFLRSEDAQKFDQAKRNFINAVLRRESGAVIAPEEFANADQQYFPQPGDGPEVIEQKRRNRETTIQGLKVSSGQGANFALPPAAQPAQGGKQRTSSGVEWSIER